MRRRLRTCNHEPRRPWQTAIETRLPPTSDERRWLFLEGHRRNGNAWASEVWAIIWTCSVSFLRRFRVFFFVCLSVCVRSSTVPRTSVYVCYLSASLRVLFFLSTPSHSAAFLSSFFRQYPLPTSRYSISFPSFSSSTTSTFKSSRTDVYWLVFSFLMSSSRRPLSPPPHPPHPFPSRSPLPPCLFRLPFPLS